MQIQFAAPGTLTALPPLALYVHIPWCIQKCPYCDFNSHGVRGGTWDEQAYVDALLLDLQYELPFVWGRAVETVFIGGGTPSLFSAASIERLLSGIRALVKLLPEAEITLEANPGTFEREKFRTFRDAGVTRLSVGVQSFHDDALQCLGRVHNGDEAKRAVEHALTLFPRVNADLMYALPFQTADAARKDVETAVALGLTHISAYHLTMEPNTPFGHRPPQGLPEEESAEDIEDAVHDGLKAAGFEHYETSAFARNGHYCRHNLNYWQFGDYIGIGAGAHGKISSYRSIERTVRKRHPNDYLQAIFRQPESVAVRTPIAKEELAFEFMMNALRLSRGVPSLWLEERTGVPLASVARQIGKAQSLGLLDTDPQFLKPTAAGQRYLNNLLQCFL